MVLGLMIGLGFWWVATVSRSSAPEYDPQRSPAGFWSDVQTSLQIYRWRHEDNGSVGVFGDEFWAQKIMGTLAAGCAFEGCFGDHRDNALSMITNHDFSTESDVRKAWLDWWQTHQSENQEQWIQQGFKAHGFDITLPSSQEDWPQLLQILGATAGPDPWEERGRQGPQMIYPLQVRYNAYRWLRDSGFDPVRCFLDEARHTLTPEQSGGLIDYVKFKLISNVPPPPGRMAFAPPPDWGYLGAFGKDRLPFSLRTNTQIYASLISLFLIGVGWKISRSKQPGIALRPSTRRRMFGGFLFTFSLCAACVFWGFTVPWIQGRAPDYTPHLSAQGFWESKQTHLKWGPWWHEDGNLVGLFGDKEWAAKIIDWIASGKDIESCQAGHRDSALPLLTNQKFDLSDSGQAWQAWWQKNEAKTQEQWIQEGFKKRGFDIALPPTEKDWPQLLTLLGSTAGPAPAKWEEQKSTPPSMLHPFYARYNAYRWLRDSGFEPVLYALAHRSQMSGEERGGLLEYQARVLDMQRIFESQVPGCLAFAPKESSGWVDPFTFKESPTLLQTRFQLTFTSGCAILGLIGWGIMRPRTLRNGRPDAVTP